MRKNALLLVFLAATVATAQNKGHGKFTQALYLDNLTGTLYHERFDGTLEPAGHTPGIPNNAPVQLKLLNVNTYRYRVHVRVHGENLFTSTPPALFTSSGILGAGNHEVLTDSTIDQFAKAADGNSRDINALHSRDVGGDDVAQRLKDLNVKLAQMQDQLDAVSQLAALDETLLSLARQAPDPVLAPGITDPRDPERKALAQFRSDLQAQVVQVVGNASGTGASTMKATFSRDIQAGAQPAPLTRSQLLALAEQRVSMVQDTFADIKDDYDKIHGSLSSAAQAASRDITDASKAQTATSLDRLSQHVDRAYKRVEAAVTSLDDDAAVAARRRSEARAADIYSRLMAENFYEAKSFVNTPDADVLVYDVDVTDPMPQQAAATTSVAPVSGATSTASVSRDLGDTGGGTAGTPPDAPAQTAPETQGPDQGNLVARQRVRVYVSGKTKVDFSTGVNFSNLTDESYTTTQLPNGKFALVRGARDQIRTSPAAFMHVYQTTPSGVSPALTFGIAPGTSGSDLQYFLGGSLLVGKDQRFIITGGLTGAKVMRLSGFKANETFDTAPSGNLTSSVFRTGYFLGLSFNVGK